MKIVRTVSTSLRLVLALVLFASGCLLQFDSALANERSAEKQSRLDSSERIGKTRLPGKSSLNYYQLPLSF